MSGFAERIGNDEWPNIEIKSKTPSFFKPQLLKADSDRNGRIVGGWEVARNSHPYQVGLLFGIPNNDRTSYLCGGSIINNKTILTAAHCTEGTDRVQVIVGAHSIRIDEDTQQRFFVNSSRYRCHFGYNPFTLNNDVCIILLTEEIKFNDFVRPIDLPRDSNLRERSFVTELATVR
jgi:secreted trypsin-like serine protease